MVDGATDTRGAILDAARDEVLAHGVRRTTASDIARRSGVSRQTFYRYWPDAQAVFAALVTRELVAVLPVEAPPADSLDDLVEMLVATADGIRTMALVERLRQTDRDLFARYVLERLGASQRAIHAELTRRIEHGQSAGYVRPGAPRAISAMLLLVLQSAVLSSPLVTEWLDARTWADELAHAVRGLLARTPA